MSAHQLKDSRWIVRYRDKSKKSVYTREYFGRGLEAEKKAPEIITYRDQPVQRIKKAFYAAKKRAGINRRLRIYDFRHSFATTVLCQEADLKSTSEIMGHSRPGTTMKHYQHTNLKLHRKTINKLPDLKLPD